MVRISRTGNALLEQVVDHPGDLGKAHESGHQVLDQLRRGLGELVEQLLHTVLTDQLVGLVLEHLAEVRGNHRAAVDHRVALGLRIVALRGIDPHGVETKGGILGGDALEFAEDLPGIDRQLPTGKHLALAGDDIVQTDAVLFGDRSRLSRMCTEWIRKPSSWDSFLRTPLMRPSRSPPWLRSTSEISR
jgi:hypothetical protein